MNHSHATHNRRASLLGATLAALLLGPLGMGCDTQAGGSSSVVPGSTDPREDQPEGWAEGESAQELKLRKDRLYTEFRGVVGEPVATPDACEKVCSLATSICGVQEKLCNIADDHPGEAEYQDLCREAKKECRETQDACIRCVENHAASGACSGEAADAAADPAPTAD